MHQGLHVTYSLKHAAGTDVNLPTLTSHRLLVAMTCPGLQGRCSRRKRIQERNDFVSSSAVGLVGKRR